MQRLPSVSNGAWLPPTCRCLAELPAVQVPPNEAVPTISRHCEAGADPRCHTTVPHLPIAYKKTRQVGRGDAGKPGRRHVNLLQLGGRAAARWVTFSHAYRSIWPEACTLMV